MKNTGVWFKKVFQLVAAERRTERRTVSVQVHEACPGAELTLLQPTLAIGLGKSPNLSEGSPELWPFRVTGSDEGLKLGLCEWQQGTAAQGSASVWPGVWKGRAGERGEPGPRILVCVVKNWQATLFQGARLCRPEAWAGGRQVRPPHNTGQPEPWKLGKSSCYRHPSRAGVSDQAGWACLPSIPWALGLCGSDGCQAVRPGQRGCPGQWDTKRSRPGTEPPRSPPAAPPLPAPL